MTFNLSVKALVVIFFFKETNKQTQKQTNKETQDSGYPGRTQIQSQLIPTGNLLLPSKQLGKLKSQHQPQTRNDSNKPSNQKGQGAIKMVAKGQAHLWCNVAPARIAHLAVLLVGDSLSLASSREKIKSAHFC